MVMPTASFLFSSLLIGMVGVAMFIYGKRQANPVCLGLGILMCVFPYFVSSLIVMWGIAAACMGALYVLPRIEA